VFCESFWNIHDMGDTIPSTMRVGDARWEDTIVERLADAFCSPIICDSWDHPIAVDFSKTTLTEEDVAALRRLIDIQFLELEECRFPPDSFASALQQLNSIKWLLLRDSNVDDLALRALPRMRDLTWLDLRSTAVTDEGLASLRDLPNLRVLLLDETAITDAGLVHMQGLASLERLELRGAAVGDQGLDAVCSLPNLSRLVLSGTKITPAALTKLARLPRLDYLRISDTRIKEADADEFRKLRPSVYVQCEWFDF
jgi:hypothetical protein